MKRKSAYHMLRDTAREFARKVAYPQRRGMWTYPKARLAEEVWCLDGLYERVKAADQLGYDVVLFAEDHGLVVRYVQKRPDVPYQFSVWSPAEELPHSRSVR